MEFKRRGDDVLVTSRSKEVAIPLLDSMGLESLPLSAQGSGTFKSLLFELIRRDWRLYRVLREFRPDVIAAIGGTFAAQSGWFASVPSVVFYDTENARLQNLMTYPFASSVVVPECYSGWTPRRRTYRYKGVHELAYLHPDYFRPNYQLAVKSGLKPDIENYLVRLVSWKANHDIAQSGLTPELTSKIVNYLRARGNVIISSEGALPLELESARYAGKPEHLHHLMAFCRGFVGESPTMASECAILGVPSVYIARQGLSYVEFLEAEYGLIRNVHSLSWESIFEALGWLDSVIVDEVRRSLDRLFLETVDVSALMVAHISAVALASSGQ